MIRRFPTLIALAIAALGAAKAGAQTIQLNGAGATFPYPIYSKWFSEYHKIHPNVQINYQSIGSGGGIRQVTERTVDFGASDGPMTAEQIQGAPGILHFPMVMGAVVPVYNTPGVDAELKFTGPVLADVFMGKITKWSDKAIAALNPGVGLPTRTSVVHRADGSGTTYIFADYLGSCVARMEAEGRRGDLGQMAGRRRRKGERKESPGRSSSSPARSVTSNSSTRSRTRSTTVSCRTCRGGS